MVSLFINLTNRLHLLQVFFFPSQHMVPFLQKAFCPAVPLFYMTYFYLSI